MCRRHDRVVKMKSRMPGQFALICYRVYLLNYLVWANIEWGGFLSPENIITNSYILK